MPLDPAPIRALLDIHHGLGASKRKLGAHIAAYERVVPAMLAEVDRLTAASSAVEWEDRAGKVQGTLARWKAHRGGFMFLASDNGSMHSALGEWRGWSLQLGSWTDSGPETGEPGKAACFAAYLRACGMGGK